MDAVCMQCDLRWNAESYWHLGMVFKYCRRLGFAPPRTQIISITSLTLCPGYWMFPSKIEEQIL